MRIQICPKCGSPMNVAFALYSKEENKVTIQCPKCHMSGDDKSSAVETLFLPDEDLIETRAGIEGIEARVIL